MRWIIPIVALVVAAPALAWHHGSFTSPPPAFTPTYYIYGF